MIRVKRLKTAWLALPLFLTVPVYGASVTGEVRISYTPEQLNPIKVSKDQDYCGQSLPNETYLIGPNGALKNVVVFIDKPPTGTPIPQKINVLDNNGCRFSPRVMAIRLGDKLIINNNDPKLHIVHSYLQQRTVFNASLPFRGSKLDMTSKIRSTGLLNVSCDTHNWMRAFIYVFDHPFFAVTDEKGSFSIPNLPLGHHTLKAWHEDAGVQSWEVVVSGDRETIVNVDFTKK